MLDHDFFVRLVCGMFHRMNSSSMLIVLYIKQFSCEPFDNNIASDLRVNGHKSIGHIQNRIVIEKMKSFQSIQADCALLGIDSYKLRKNHRLNLRSSIVFLSYISSIVSCVYYFCYIDKSFERYISSFYVTISILVCFLQFINLFWQMTKLTDFFSGMDDYLLLRE